MTKITRRFFTLSLLALGLCLSANMPISKAFAGKCYKYSITSDVVTAKNMRAAKRKAKKNWVSKARATRSVLIGFINENVPFTWNCAKNRKFAGSKIAKGFQVKATATPCKCN